MFAVVRERTPGARMPADRMEEFRRFRAKQPGYRGTVEVEIDDGRTLLVVVWETAEQAQAAGAALEPEGRRLNGPDWAGPPRVIGQGQIAYDDLTTS